MREGLIHAGAGLRKAQRPTTVEMILTPVGFVHEYIGVVPWAAEWPDGRILTFRPLLLLEDCALGSRWSIIGQDFGYRYQQTGYSHASRPLGSTDLDGHLVGSYVPVISNYTPARSLPLRYA